MTGHRSFNELRAAMSPERQARVAEKTSALRQNMSLVELRRARRLTQENLGATLHVGQASIAKMEKRADMNVSSLRSYIEAMGGKLEVVASFPDGSVAITNFASIGKAES